jgi:hypothetical protein
MCDRCSFNDLSICALLLLVFLLAHFDDCPIGKPVNTRRSGHLLLIRSFALMTKSWFPIWMPFTVPSARWKTIFWPSGDHDVTSCPQY